MQTTLPAPLNPSLQPCVQQGSPSPPLTTSHATPAPVGPRTAGANAGTVPAIQKLRSLLAGTEENREAEIRRFAHSIAEKMEELKERTLAVEEKAKDNRVKDVQAGESTGLDGLGGVVPISPFRTPGSLILCYVSPFCNLSIFSGQIIISAVPEQGAVPSPSQFGIDFWKVKRTQEVSLVHIDGRGFLSRRGPNPGGGPASQHHFPPPSQQLRAELWTSVVR